jgi:hypothetical protein
MSERQGFYEEVFRLIEEQKRVLDEGKVSRQIADKCQNRARRAKELLDQINRGNK